MTRRRFLATIGTILLLVVGAGCLGVPAADPPRESPTTSTTTPSPTAQPMPDSLDSRLAALYAATDRADYADTHGLAYADGRVAVVIELRPGGELPREYDVAVTARHDELVQATVPVDDLPDLAREDDVKYVRPPHQPEPAGSAVGGRL